MIIENIEALKLWLKKTLTPICDADPNTLSQYVVALLKKNKPDKDLKEFCQDQLDVFLQQKTKGFVETLFETLTSKSYLALAPSVTPPVPTSVPAPPKDSSPAQTASTTVSQNLQSSQQPAKTEKRKKSNESQEDSDRQPYRRHSGSPPRGRGRESDRDDRRRRYEDRSRFPAERRYTRDEFSRRRTRSRSRERSPRNRSRGPSNRSRGRSRDRSRSPFRGRSRSRSRSFSPSRSPNIRRPDPDSRGSTPIQDNGKYSTEADTGPSPAMPIPSTITVVSSDNRYDWNSMGRRNTPPPPRPRCKDYDEKGFCMRGDLCPFDHGLDPVIVEDINLPPGLPYASGPPPPPPPGIPGIQPPLPGPRGPGPGPPRGPGMMGPRPPPRPPHPPRPPRQDRPHEPYQPEGYNPEAPAMNPARGGYWMPPGGPRPRPPFHPHPQPAVPNMRGRDLVQVQTVPEQPKKEDPSELQVPGFTQNGQNSRTVVAPKRPYNKISQPPSTNAQSEVPRPQPAFNKFSGPPPPKRNFDYNRLGSYRHANSENATLEVRKVPPEFNTIPKLNEHFGKFGTLVNIRVRYEDAPDAALITFSCNAEANSAYRSSEPVFNNRFIKLFWHKPAQQSGSGSNQSTEDSSGGVREDQRIPIKTRLGIPSPDKLQLNNLTKKTSQSQDSKSLLYTGSAGTITKTVFNPAALKSKTNTSAATELHKKTQLEQQAKKQETLKKKLELQKQKQQLLQKYIEQQKLLLGKLEKSKNMTSEDKAQLMTTIKDLSAKIDQLKGESMPKKPARNSTFKSDAQAKKEILDTELELISKQHAGDDTSDLRKKLEALTKEAASMGLLTTGRGRGRGLSRGRGRGSTTWSRGGRGGRGRGFLAANRSLDRRPKQLKISGFAEEDKNELLVHLAQHGEVENIEFDGETAAIVTFKTRMDAEKAAMNGNMFKGNMLVMKWHMPGLSSSALQSNEDLDDDDDDDVSGILDEIDEDALLGPDDEEEEDEESRSWRR